MERMAGKVAGDHQFEEMGGVVNRSIDHESTQCTHIQVSLLRRYVALFLG